MSPILEHLYNYQSSSSITILYASVFTLTFASFFLYIKRNFAQNRHKPPGPRRLPIIGNLHQLGDLPHRSLYAFSKVYGPLMLLKLGQIPTLIVSSPSLAEKILKTNDLNFCTRPALTTWQKLSYGGLDLAFSEYTDEWRQLRKLTIVEFFNNKKVLQSLQHTREQELDVMMGSIASASDRGEAVNLSEMLLCFMTNVVCMKAFGKRFSSTEKCGKSEVEELIGETIELMGGFVAGDFFPSMQYAMNVVFGVQRRMEKNFEEMDAFLERELKEKEREVENGGDGDDFASVLARMRKDASLADLITRDRAKAVLMNLFIAGSDTAAVSMIWAMTELIRHPRVLKKVQDEIRQVTRGKHRVEETDLQHLKYFSSVVKEVLRLHPPGPIILPRECRKACNIDGYLIPTKTRVYINVWAIARDPNTWENVDEFLPERFEGSGIDYKGLHFELLPFGGGRRLCPGLAMGATTLELTLANLLLKFNWELPNGMLREDIDMSECFGIVVSKKVPLVLAGSKYEQAVN